MASTTITGPTTTSNPIERYDAIRASSKFIFVVFYRGHWCPFCQTYLKQLTSLLPSIQNLDGHILTVTSEPLPFLQKMRQATGYTGETIVDVKNELAGELKRRGIIDVAISEKKGYEFGMVQSAVLIGTGAKEGGGRVLYKWAIVPSLMNLGGAKDRPSLKEVWENVEAEMKGKGKVHEVIPFMTFFQGIRQKIFG